MSLDPADLTRLYERSARPLLVFFQRRVDDPEVAVDLMADCFTIALERRHQFRGEGDDALSGWLWSIAQSVLREYERRDESARRWARRLGRERRALTDREIERIEELAASEGIREAVTTTGDDTDAGSTAGRATSLRSHRTDLDGELRLAGASRVDGGARLP